MCVCARVCACVRVFEMTKAYLVHWKLSIFNERKSLFFPNYDFFFKVILVPIA